MLILVTSIKIKTYCKCKKRGCFLQRKHPLKINSKTLFIVQEYQIYRQQLLQYLSLYKMHNLHHLFQNQ